MKTRRILVRIAKACLALLVLVWLAWVVATLWAEREFEAKVSALRERGVRADLADFDRPPIPDERNAAPWLRTAMTWCDEQDRGFSDHVLELERLEPAGTEPGDDELKRRREEAWKGAAKWVDDLAPWYAEVDRAVRLPECDFGIDYGDWDAHPSGAYEITQRLRETHEWAVRVLERQGGAAEDGVRKCETLLLWAHQIEPAFIFGYLNSLMAAESACQLLMRVARLPGLNIETARRTLEPLLAAAEDDGDRLRDALQSEFAAFVEVSRYRTTWAGSTRLCAGRLSGEEPFPGLPVHMLVRRSELWTEAAREIDLWGKGCAVLEADGPETYEELKAFAEENEVDSWLPGYLRVAFHKLLPGVQKARLVHRARLRLARLGLAALEYRKNHGAWPKSPAELSPLFPGGVPVDPFTRKPFEFAIDEGALRFEAAVPWLDKPDKYEGEFREDKRIYWALEAPR